jgi:hypothetical protein
MGRPTDTREVLLAEALGDFVKVLDRIDAVKPTLEKSCGDLKFTADRLLGDIEPFQKRIVGMALEIQDRTLGHITERADFVVRNTTAEQIAAMQASARRIFKDEVGPSLDRVAGELREANLREQPAWKAWLTHVAAAVSAASCTCVLMVYLTPTNAAESQATTRAPSQGCVAPTPPPLKARDRR